MWTLILNIRFPQHHLNSSDSRSQAEHCHHSIFHSHHPQRRRWCWVSSSPELHGGGGTSHTLATVQSPSASSYRDFQLQQIQQTSYYSHCGWLIYFCSIRLHNYHHTYCTECWINSDTVYWPCQCYVKKPGSRPFCLLKNMCNQMDPASYDWRSHRHSMKTAAYIFMNTAMISPWWGL